jgi:protein-S-isoprenylcysteine O-methyltransferase Ste14
LGDAVAVCGCLWLLASVLVLGRCFGILPEARGLVRRGPYRFVRHPVYLGEITAFAGLTLAALVPRNVGLLAVLVGAQMIRARFEERALSAAFPEYASYMETTGRLFPTRRRRSAGPVVASE